MTWTYSSTSLSTDLAKVRLKIGDTNTNNQLLSDEEIQVSLDEYSDTKLASIGCIRAILAKLARDIDRSNLGMSAQRSQQIQHYKDLLAELSSESGLYAEPFFGGGSLDEKDSLESDSDYTGNVFVKDADTNNG